MSVAIHSVLFNHTPGDTRTGAMNVRRNSQQPAILPEWQAGVTPDSVAAYAIGSVDEMALSIHAELQSTTTRGPIEVRAIELPLRDFPLALYLMLIPTSLWTAPVLNQLVLASYLTWLDWMLNGGNVLGEVVARNVVIGANGSSGLVPFRLRNVRLRARGVGASTVVWRWQYREGAGSAWRDAGFTTHTICATLAEPTPPWRTAPLSAADTALPWTDALRIACRWAAGTHTRAETTRALANAIFALGADAGGNLFEYGCEIGAPSMYVTSLFNLSAFLDRLQLGPGNGRYVNCSDCASFLVTFANALGCDLWESRMGMYNPMFPCNPFLVIGGRAWDEPCGSPLGFAYHEVAWAAECREDDDVSDACIAFSGLTTVPPPGTVPRIASSMKFGRPNAGLYRDWIAAPQAREICRPRPLERVRRPVF